MGSGGAAVSYLQGRKKEEAILITDKDCRAAGRESCTIPFVINMATAREGAREGGVD